MQTTKEKSATRQRGTGTLVLLSHGFRPFFLFGSAYAAFAMSFWIITLRNGTQFPGLFQGVAWHSHEMIFGYLAAIIAGFILTAVPNWTGRLPVSGKWLGLLLCVWIAGRISIAFTQLFWVGLVIDAAFLVMLAASLWRELIAGKNWRNLPACFLISLFAAANVIAHLGLRFPALAGYGDRLALATVAMLIGLIGGRIVPSFTRNWMAKMGIGSLPAAFGRFDKGVLAATATALLFWVAAPENQYTGITLIISGAAHLFRAMRWRGDKTLNEPIVAVLHAGYFWLALAFVMIGFTIVFPAFLDTSSSLHVLTAGAVGTMTLAIMTRATLGHTGRGISANTMTILIYYLVVIGAVIRVTAAYLPFDYILLLRIGGALWAAAFLLFGIVYGPMLAQRSRV